MLKVVQQNTDAAIFLAVYGAVDKYCALIQSFKGRAMLDFDGTEFDAIEARLKLAIDGITPKQKLALAA